jgi:hypothetical protein
MSRFEDCGQFGDFHSFALFTSQSVLPVLVSPMRCVVVGEETSP